MAENVQKKTRIESSIDNNSQYSNTSVKQRSNTDNTRDEGESNDTYLKICDFVDNSVNVIEENAGTTKSIISITKNMNLEKDEVSPKLEKKELDLEIIGGLKFTRKNFLALQEEIEWLKKNAVYIPKQELELPKEAPMLWVDYKAKYYPEKDIVDMLDDQEAWGDYTKSGVLYQDQLKAIDFKAWQRLKNLCTKNREKMSLYLPPKKERTKKELSNVSKKSLKEMNRLSVNSRIKST